MTAICWPSSKTCAVRAAVPVFWVKEKLTTPPETLPIVSQLWSLVGAKTPVSGTLLGTTGASAPLPAAAPSLAGPGTNARGSSLTLLFQSPMYTLPEASTATPHGAFSPDDARVPSVCVAAFHSLIA